MVRLQLVALTAKAVIKTNFVRLGLSAVVPMVGLFLRGH
jgi:hypothetical protein